MSAGLGKGTERRVLNHHYSNGSTKQNAHISGRFDDWVGYQNVGCAGKI
jgi:hypothetical protein